MRNIGVLALEGCIHSTVTGPFDIFSMVGHGERELSHPQETFCRVSIVTPDARPVRCFNGLTVEGTNTLHDGAFYDLIITPALMGDLEPLLADRQLSSWLAAQHQRGACICSVCAGSFLLAQAGLLAGKQATTHWALADTFAKRFPEVDLRAEKMVVDEGDIISAGGVTAYLDLCMYLLTRFGSPELASSMSRLLLIDHSRQTQIPYSSYTFSKKHGDFAILKAQERLEKDFAQQITVGIVAKAAGLEERTFNRRFKKATGDTPVAYLRGLRIEAARRLLETTSVSIDTITREVGYEDTSSFRRLFKQCTGLTPSDYRKKFSHFGHQ